MEENKLLKLNKKELVALFYVSKEMSRGFIMGLGIAVLFLFSFVIVLLRNESQLFKTVNKQNVKIYNMKEELKTDKMLIEFRNAQLTTDKEIMSSKDRTIKQLIKALRDKK